MFGTLDWVSVPTVSVHDFVKRYGDVVAVDGISFDVYPGEVFGLLGPNGAGKTTALECLEGLRIRTSGEMTIGGIDPEENSTGLADLIGVQLQAASLPATMTPVDAMRFFAAYRGLAPRLDLLEWFGLEEHLETRYEDLSTGLKRRLSLALAIAHDPPVVILDEPTAGLDVASRARLHESIRDMKQRGKTVLLATHDMAEAESLADRVIILLRGKVVAMGSPRELTGSGDGLTKVSIRTERMSVLDTQLPGGVTLTSTPQDGYAVAFTADPGSAVAVLLDSAKAEEDPLIDLRVERPSLEERFLELTEVTA